MSFFFTATATTEIYTLSLHDALPICDVRRAPALFERGLHTRRGSADGDSVARRPVNEDRKSTRLNSSHMSISYAVFCLKKKKNKKYLSTCDLVTNHTPFLMYDIHRPH